MSKLSNMYTYRGCGCGKVETIASFFNTDRLQASKADFSSSHFLGFAPLLMSQVHFCPPLNTFLNEGLHVYVCVCDADYMYIG